VKRIPFCYGHRLVHHTGKCRFLHGHNATAEITVESDKLDSTGFVIDFGVIKEKVKTLIDFEYDHTMLLWEGDPVVSFLKDAGEKFRLFPFHPTAENLAERIHNQVRLLLPEVLVRSVGIFETGDSRATYMEKEYKENEE